ncbi:calcium-responsive transcription factor isoform X8 [Erpetoichthys calabaricus]|uniref:calcium-responsive transcription factor isoform X4 n=1 Tax=Erpetoichthys calabaricus TaxID=27687 RepID=UPI0010A09C77|nr:calcium-responsive transcription factor isoform X4 [Erpetoichthys calabaricus]XP_028661986.1 calcium-responsive transcription factor isoform X1 [Erpetoichthys calabaricus]XP_051787117.1 calcium-responsive transcription factor isoform X1 [Erpetoichthys calabaricus]XP_051787118.1 calcium-responsive transcription factor isoform X2 [Erpetoichthys calabaricus]XP_051787119.1 calcium-responsive transcription factor isoform X3 [Erpetoichthys calabaricus]XP_051787120.1 calcium-responsive transcripti
MEEDDGENKVYTDVILSELLGADCQLPSVLPSVLPSEPAQERPNPIALLPITVQISSSPCVSQTSVEQTFPSQQSAEFHIFDQNGQPIKCERMMIVAGQSENGQVLHVIPSPQVLVPPGQEQDSRGCPEEKLSHAEDVASNLSLTTLIKNEVLSADSCFLAPPQPLPPSAPAWARRLRSCEKIGDSYRGYCVNDSELESVLALHKQLTQSVWGTRQSPSPAKPATRLMWKSQYVPYDGIPFVNAGSRAIVMECQFGPRRKGVQSRKGGETDFSFNQKYKATCPARIYIKKVRKFPEHRVPTDPKIDKKIVRQEQEKAFFNLKKSLWEAGGVLRYYVQLPTQKAHQYHDLEAPQFPPTSPNHLLPVPVEEELEEKAEGDDDSCEPSRLHPRVAEKIRELVSQGMDQVYLVRKQLRKFVEREMFKPDEVPERHNLTYFPTVNDIKNHIHEAQKALQPEGANDPPAPTETPLHFAADAENAPLDTVTLTLAPAATEVGGILTSPLGSLEVSETLSQEAVQLLGSFSTLQPKILAHMQQLPPTFPPAEGAPGLLSLNAQPLPGSQVEDILESSSVPTSHPPLLTPSQFLQPSASLTDSMAALPTVVNLGESGLFSMGQLVTVSAVGEGHLAGGVHQILLEDGQTIPLQIVGDDTPVAPVSGCLGPARVNEEGEHGDKASVD